MVSLAETQAGVQMGIGSSDHLIIGDSELAKDTDSAKKVKGLTTEGTEEHGGKQKLKPLETQQLTIV
jgi:hypothetical protein